MADYYVRRADVVRGPVAARRIREMAVAGKLQKSDHVRRGEEGDWFTAASIAGLFDSAVSDDEIIIDPLAKAAGSAAGAVAGAAKASAGLIVGAARGLMSKAKEVRDVAARPAATERGGGLLARLTAEKQDPKQVEQVTTRVAAILTSREEIVYVAVQARPLVNWFPDCVVLTTKRLILYRPKILGRVDFEDHLWRNLSDARLQENMIGSTLTFAIADGSTISMDYLPKEQARCLYRFAQENEEIALETRRERRMEEDRARAGGVNIQTNVGVASAPPAASTPAHGDPMASLRQLKEMLDAGLISAGDFDTKKAEILARM